jgi:hypothetical protein
MSRVFGIELRRSAALGSALILLVVGIVVLFFAEGIGFATGWMQLAMSQRLYLALLWPLALAAGAWQARREHRSNVGELFASTPRPRAHRTVPTLAVMAIAVVAAYLVQALAGGLWIIGTAEYLPAAVFTVTAVGILSLIAAVWLGLAAGRLLPSPVTAPALGIAGLAFLLLVPAMTRPHGWLALVFSPIYEMNMPGAYATVPGRASLSQALWLAALAVAAVLLFASDGWRLRVAALLPVVLGAALAITVMPRDDRYVTDAFDPVARELVCTDDAPKVCVSRVHTGLLAEVTGPARAGLAALAKLPGAPQEMHEDTTTYPDYDPPFRADVVLLRVEAGSNGHLANRAGVAAEVAAGAFASQPDCDKRADVTDTLAAAFWLLGREPVAPNEIYDPTLIAEAREQWNSLQQLPPQEVTARLVALRQAAAACAVTDQPLSGGTR